MLEVVYSNRTEALLDALVRDLAAARPSWGGAAGGVIDGAGLLRPIHLVVPDRHVAAWVKLGVARLTGLCANVRVHYLKRFLVELCEGAGAGVRLVDAARLQGLVLAALLDDDFLAAAEVAPARAWIEAVADPAARDLRRWQLAERLAHLFEEYELSRPELLDGWLRAAAGGRGRRARPGAGGWQERVWLAVFGRGGLLERHAAPGERWVTLRDLLAAAPRVRLEELALPPRLHFFGFSYLATTYVRLLARLARGAAVHVYAPHPCREDDAELDAARRAAAPLDGGDPFELLAEARTPAPALRWWGRPGREHLRLLCGLGGARPVAAPSPAAPSPAAPSPAAPPALLRRLQRDLEERRAPDPGAPPGPGDGTITILACPGPRREAEIVASEIWRCLAADPTLRCNEIAVVVAGDAATAYLPHLQAAFRECHGIPHSLADLPLAGSSRVIEAAELLLRLPFGDYARPDLLRLVTHPAVVRATFPDADPDAWRAWCHALGIVHGADHGDHAGTYIEHDILNWDQGLRRLALGAFMAGERSGDPGVFALGAERYLVEEPADATAAAQLGLLVRSLVADSRQLAAARLPLRDWARLLAELVATYVAGAPGEEGERRACLRTLQGLERAAPGDRPVSYRIAHEAARAALQGLAGASGRAFADGVVVSTLRPMRAVPFRVVFVMGLGAGVFPAADRRDHLDLRGGARRAGDVSPRERDQYLFLETLLAARDRLYLSYVDREPTSGAALQPAAVLVELEHLLAHGYLDEVGLAALRVRHPLRRHDERYFGDVLAAPPAGAPPAAAGAPLSPLLLPAAHAEAQARALARLLERHAGGALLEGTAPRLALLEPAARAAAAAALGVLEPPAPAPAAAAPRPVRVSLATLRRFLECPLQGHAGFVLGLEAEDDDVLAVTDEPFATGFPEAVGFLRRVITEALVQGRDPLAHHAEQARRRELRGQAPTGVLGEQERERQRESLATWLAQLAPAGAAPPPARVIRFGGGDEHALVDTVAPPLVLEVAVDDDALPRPLRVEITGAAGPLAADGAASLIFSHRGVPRGELQAAKLQRDVLRGFLDHVILAATGRAAEQRREVRVCLQEPGAAAPVVFGLKPLTTAAASDFLRRVVGSLLGRVHDYLLPCEAAFIQRLPARGAPRSLRECVAEVRAEEHYSSAYGPIALLERYDAPDERTAAGSVDERFGVFFELLEDPQPWRAGGRS